MRNRHYIMLGCVMVVGASLAAMLTRADITATDTRKIEIEAGGSLSSPPDPDLRSMPKVTTWEGQTATLKVVRELIVPNYETGEKGFFPVEAGVILSITPTFEDDKMMLNGSARILDSVFPEKGKGNTNVSWYGFKELKLMFSIEAKDPEERYSLGPIEMDGKEHIIWLSAREISE